MKKYKIIATVCIASVFCSCQTSKVSNKQDNLNDISEPVIEIKNLKDEEKKLYNEYKAKLAELKKVQKEKEADEILIEPDDTDLEEEEEDAQEKDSAKVATEDSVDEKETLLKIQQAQEEIRELNEEEKAVVDDFQGREEYEKVYKNPDKYLFETSAMLALPETSE